MESKDDVERLSEQETERRMDDALRRALNTLHQPHKPTLKKGDAPKGAAKLPRKKARA